jgi:threonine synthase
MKFYSTKDKSLRVDFEQAVKAGLAPDGGLFMPEKVEVLKDEFWRDLDSKTFSDLSFEIALAFLSDSLPQQALKKIVEQAITFDAPLVNLEKGIYALELYHGPTLAFKDFGARFLASVLGYYSEKENKEVTILVATSGDTGSAVAHGFYNVPGTKVIVLYPAGKVSDLQEKQFATLGGNIEALEVDGTFDDCQRLVKDAFADKEIGSKRRLTSANSINVARLIPQMFYYFRGYQQLTKEERKHVVVSVPSGNFGNLTAGLLAKKMGLPVERFIAATNENDIVPKYLHTKKFTPASSIPTISNAMDVGNPSNFFRLLDLYGEEGLSSIVSGFSFSDRETRKAIEDVSNRHQYVLDPHGAVGYLGLKKYTEANPGCCGIFLETAHPAKFRDVVEESIGKKINVPERLSIFTSKKKITTKLSNNFSHLKSYLLS